MSKIKLNLRLERKFGRNYYYPDCEVSRALCLFAKKQTFIDSDLQKIGDVFTFKIREF